MNVSPLPPWFLEKLIGRCSPRDCLFHVIPVQLMRTLPDPCHHRLEPRAVLEASQHIEADEHLSVLHEKGIFTQALLEGFNDKEEILYEVSAAVARAVQLGKIPVLMGDAPMITIGALHALLEQKQPIGIVQVSARARLDKDDRGNPLGSACLARRALDMGHALFQIGVSGLSPEDAHFRKKQNVGHLDAAAIITDRWPNPILPPDFPTAIYINLDLEVLAMVTPPPATCHPSPGGLSEDQLREALIRVISDRHVLGFNVVGTTLATGPGKIGATAARLMAQIMVTISQSRERFGIDTSL